MYRPVLMLCMSFGLDVGDGLRCPAVLLKLVSQIEKGNDKVEDGINT